jgi:hypothetical protein
MQVYNKFLSVIIFNMSTGLNILKITAVHVELYICCLKIMHGYTVCKIVVENGQH